MKLLNRPTDDRPLSGRSTKSLRRWLVAAGEELRALDARSAAQVIRECRTDEVLGRMEELSTEIRATRTELRRRDGEVRRLRSVALHTRDPVRDALEWTARQLGGRLTLDARRLSASE